MDVNLCMNESTYVHTYTYIRMFDCAINLPNNANLYLRAIYVLSPKRLDVHKYTIPLQNDVTMLVTLYSGVLANVCT